MALNRSVCIFVGAGCSKALANVPVQSELARDLLRWDAQHSHHHLSATLRKLLEKLQDLELILSYYQSRAYPTPGVRERPYPQELMFLRVALAMFLDQAEKGAAPTHHEDSANLLDHFLQRRRFKPTDISIVTTNYDLVLERILEVRFGTRSWCYPGLGGDPCIEGRIPIFKLHGSINWMEARGPASIWSASRPDIPFRILEPQEMSLSHGQSSGCYFVHGEQKYTPILIPPLYQKEHWFRDDNERWRTIFEGVWKGAFDCMRAAASRLFWGYSLPQADVHMFATLVKVLDASRAEVEIVDQRPDTGMIRLGRYLESPVKIFSQGLTDYLWRSQAVPGTSG